MCGERPTATAVAQGGPRHDITRTFIAVLAWTSRLASGIVAPLGLVFSSVPVVTLIPVLARLFGYDIKTVVAIVVVISFLPAFVFTAAGLKSLPPGSDDLFRVLGASRWRRFAHLVAPSCNNKLARKVIYK